GQSVTLSSMNVGRALNGGIALGTYETINSYIGVSSLFVGSAYNGGTAEDQFQAGSVTGGTAQPWLYPFIGVLEGGDSEADGSAVIPGTLQDMSPHGTATYLQVGVMHGLAPGITSGNATGLLTVAEGITGFANVRVGMATNAQSGLAQGSLTNGYNDMV